MAFQRVCGLGELVEDRPLQVEVDGQEVAVVRTGGEVFAIADECSHAAVALSEGDVSGCAIECWLHGSLFDLRSGKPTGLPATEPVPVYAVRVDGDDVHVDIENPVGDN